MQISNDELEEVVFIYWTVFYYFLQKKKSSVEDFLLVFKSKLEMKNEQLPFQVLFYLGFYFYQNDGLHGTQTGRKQIMGSHKQKQNKYFVV